MTRWLLLLIIFIMPLNISASEKDSTGESKLYIYVLKLTSGYYDENNWKEKDNEIIGIHFKRLQEMLEEGKLLMAGRTDAENDKTFGIVIYEAGSFEDAVKIANDDPAVKAGIMSVEVFPFRLALMKNN